MRDSQRDLLITSLKELGGVTITEHDDSLLLVFDGAKQKSVSKLIIEHLGLIKGVGLRANKDDILNSYFLKIPERLFYIDEDELLLRITQRVNAAIQENQDEIERKEIEDFHPLPLSSKPYNDKQQEFLDTIKISNPDLFEMMSRQFRIGNVTFRYYKLGTAFNPTVEEFNDWLEGLPPNIADAHREMGFEKSITSLPFRRFYMELHDIGLDEYLKKYLSDEDFDYHNQIRKRIYSEKNG
jgi:hypothetical protein